METLQYHSYHHHVPFHATLFPSFPPTTSTTTTTTNNTNPIFEFSASPPVSNIINNATNGRTLSPVTDISNGLHGITVSSPHVSPSKVDTLSPLPSFPSSPPRSQQKQRVRRNLSLSMDNFVKSSLSSSASEPCLPRSSTSSSLSDVISSSPTILSRPISPATTPSIPLFELDTQLLDSTTTIIKRTSPLKSPKRAREEREREEREQRMQMAEFLLNPPQPLIRSASTSILANNGRESKQRTRSLLVKSESFVIRDPSHAILPTIYGQHPDLLYVSPQTVADVMEGRYRNEIDEHYIIDCRFPYEYDGGHINTALNLTENEIKKMFIDMPQSGKKVAIIFHCEFSSQRAPRCLRFLRELDRKLNIAEYPKLSYPDVYVIEGGFKHFFQTFEDYCVGTYVEMRDERHFTEMKAHLRNFKRVRSMSADHTNIPFFQPAKFC